MKFSSLRTGSLAVALASAVVVTGVAHAFTRAVPAAAESASPPLDPLPVAAAGEAADADLREVHVDDLAKDPDAHRDRLRLRGVVAGVNQDAGVVGLIDAREFESCGTLTCAENVVPVRMAGELPPAKTLVLATGTLVEGETGLEFAADAVEVLP